MSKNEIMNNKIIVKTENLVKIFKSGNQSVRAVNGINLEIQQGEFAALAGPSGSGKTTLLNLIGGLDRPDEGEVWIENQPYSGFSSSELAEIRLNKIGFVFQSYNLIPVLTCYENIQFVLEIQGAPKKEYSERINSLLTTLGLEGLEKRRPAEMSGGQQQRVAVARSIVGRPTIVLADEPTANLDSETAANLLDLMRQLNKESGITFLFSSHDPRVLERAGRIIMLHDGKIESDDRKIPV